MFVIFSSSGWCKTWKKSVSCKLSRWRWWWGQKFPCLMREQIPSVFCSGSSHQVAAHNRCFWEALLLSFVLCNINARMHVTNKKKTHWWNCPFFCVTFVVTWLRFSYLPDAQMAPIQTEPNFSEARAAVVLMPFRNIIKHIKSGGAWLWVNFLEKLNQDDVKNQVLWTHGRVMCPKAAVTSVEGRTRRSTIPTIVFVRVCVHDDRSVESLNTKGTSGFTCALVIVFTHFWSVSRTHSFQLIFVTLWEIWDWLWVPCSYLNARTMSSGPKPNWAICGPITSRSVYCASSRTTKWQNYIANCGHWLIRKFRCSMALLSSTQVDSDGIRGRGGVGCSVYFSPFGASSCTVSGWWVLSGLPSEIRRSSFQAVQLKVERRKWVTLPSSLPSWTNSWP